MNPKAQLKHLLFVNFLDGEVDQKTIKMNLLLGVIENSKNRLVLSDGINSIEANRQSIFKRKQNADTSENMVLKPKALYCFESCYLDKIELDEDNYEFILNFKDYSLIMPSFFVTKGKNFKTLSNDLTSYQYDILNRKKLESNLKRKKEVTDNLISLNEMLFESQEVETTISNLGISIKTSIPKEPSMGSDKRRW